MKRTKREIEGMSLAFLDVICCGFGAIILMLVLTKVFEPLVLEESLEEIQARLARLEQELLEIRGESRTLDRDMIRKQNNELTEEERLTQLKTSIALLKKAVANETARANRTNVAKRDALVNQQELDEVQKRLLADFRRQQDYDAIGGIPVDAEYVIFVIDNSGSMQEAWPLLLSTVDEILDMHPVVKGIQFLNGSGSLLLREHGPQWIPDNPNQRRQVMQRLQGGGPADSSALAPGIETAISLFYDNRKNISIWVLGDDFRGGSHQETIDRVERANPIGPNGKRRVKIHAIGFPTSGGNQFAFAVLMQELTKKNGGAFRGLNYARTF